MREQKCRCEVKLELDRNFQEKVISVIRTERKRQNLSQAECDYRAGYTDGYLARLESGKRKFTFATFWCYCQVLGLEVIFAKQDAAKALEATKSGQVVCKKSL